MLLTILSFVQTAIRRAGVNDSERTSVVVSVFISMVRSLEAHDTLQLFTFGCDNEPRYESGSVQVYPVATQSGLRIVSLNNAFQHTAIRLHDTS